MKSSRISHTDTDPGRLTTIWTVHRQVGAPVRRELSVTIQQTRTIDNPFDNNGPHLETTYHDAPVTNGEPRWLIQPPAWFHQAAVAIIGGAK